MDVTLPLLMNHDTYSYNVGVSHDGRLIAYTVYSSDMYTTQLLVYDTQIEALVATYSPGRIVGDSIDFVGSKDIFNEDDSALAYGYRVEDGGWTLVALDLETGGEVYALHSEDPLAQAPASPPSLAISLSCGDTRARRSPSRWSRRSRLDRVQNSQVIPGIRRWA
jgi:hypothetical protein